MPFLDWMGKAKVVSHHNDVPFRVLERRFVHGAPEADNMIIHGDNLEALKALQLRYAGRVTCIIDGYGAVDDEFYYVPDSVTTLDYAFLSRLRPWRDGNFIYADVCHLGADRLTGVTFKKIPRDITKL